MARTKEEREELKRIEGIFAKDVEDVTPKELKDIVAHMRAVRAKFLEEETKPKRKSKREKGDMLEVSAAETRR